MFTLREISTGLRLGILDLKAFAIKMAIDQKRDQEKAGAQFVIRELTGKTNIKILYNANNKPFIEIPGTHISVSHSHDKLVIILNTSENTGVDIELIRDKILKVRHKFLNTEEAQSAGDDVEKLITVWAAKEALYKCYGLKNLDFKTNLFIENNEDPVFYGRIKTQGFNKRLQLKKEKIEDYILVYILKEVAV